MIHNPINTIDRLSKRIGGWMPPQAQKLLGNYGLLTVRIVASVCQAGTVLLTWDLWQVRDYPPLLPAANLRQLDMGWPILLSLLVVLFAPRVGILCHIAFIVLSMMMDQTRMQPYVISMALLMVGTLPIKWAHSMVCMHLVALWFYAGLHKLISVYVNGYFSSNFFLDIAPWLPDPVPQLLAASVLLTEMGVGLIAFRAQSRKLAAVLAGALHVSLFVALVLRGQNTAVWLWQFPLALGGAVWGASVCADSSFSYFRTAC
ncbi:MAG: hypothetical protein AB7Q45_07285 [Planctomycetaceae bacterium]